MKILTNDSSSDKMNRDVVQFRTNKKNFSIIWVADAHFDSTKSKLKKLQNYLDEHKDVFIIVGGDSLDVMQGRNDKRSAKGSNQFNSNDYFNQVINYVKKEFHDRYKDRIITWNRGNHDNSIIRINEIDLIQLICGTETPMGNISGYIKVMCAPAGNTKNVYSKLIYYQHIPDSGGQRSKGMLSVDTIKSKFPSADIYVTEHIHQTWIHNFDVEHVSKQGNVNFVNKWFIQAPSLKDEHDTERNGFYHEKVKGGAQTTGVIRFDFVCSDTLSCNPYLVRI